MASLRSHTLANAAVRMRRSLGLLRGVCSPHQAPQSAVCPCSCPRGDVTASHPPQMASLSTAQELMGCSPHCHPSMEQLARGQPAVGSPWKWPCNTSKELLGLAHSSCPRRPLVPRWHQEISASVEAAGSWLNLGPFGDHPGGGGMWDGHFHYTYDVLFPAKFLLSLITVLPRVLPPSRPFLSPGGVAEERGRHRSHPGHQLPHHH